MSYFTRDAISDTWEELKNGTNMDGSRIVTDEELKQTLTIPTVAPYSDHNSDITSVSYTRQRENEESTWGVWEETLLIDDDSHAAV
jgi:hypothetical protein